MLTLLKNRRILIALALLIAGVAIWYFFFRSKAVQAPLPTDQATGNQGLTAAEQQEVRSLSEALYRVLRGWSLDIFWRDSDPYDDLLQLSDRLFTAVYNDFNQMYGGNKGTLKQWIEDDWYYTGSNAGHTSQLVIQRMEKLNLS